MLEMLRPIVEKFPKAVVDDQSQTLFVHLLVCLTNDQDKDVCFMTGTLISRIGMCSVCFIIDCGYILVYGRESLNLEWYNYLNWLSATAPAFSLCFSFFPSCFLIKMKVYIRAGTSVTG